MEKDKTILELIETLKQLIRFDLLEVVDYWPADLCAIGLMKENKLIYISTYNYIGNKTVAYDFDLEIIQKNDKEKLQVVQTGRKISESELVNIVKLFLEV